MMLLPVLYIFLVLYILNTTIDLIWDSNSLLNISIIIGFIGILLVAALVKPLFTPPIVKKLFIPISRKKEPALYMFVEKICHAVGVKVPTNIEVDCSINASAYYKKRLISFLEDDLTLTIGLPVISEVL